MAQSSKPLDAVSFQGADNTVTLPLDTPGSSPLDLGLFPPGEVITLAAGGEGTISTGLETLPDGSLFVPATSPYLFANAGASGYPTVSGGNGVNQFPGGGLNYDSTVSSGKYGFTGQQTTDTTNSADIRFGAIVGTFSATPTRTSWFVIGRGATITIPATEGGSHLYLAVNDSDNGNDSGSYQVNYIAAASGTPALSSPITVSAAGAAIPGVPALSTDGFSLTFSPAVQLTPGTAYSGPDQRRYGLCRQPDGPVFRPVSRPARRRIPRLRLFFPSPRPPAPPTSLPMPQSPSSSASFWTR